MADGIFWDPSPHYHTSAHPFYFQSRIYVHIWHICIHPALLCIFAAFETYAYIQNICLTCSVNVICTQAPIITPRLTHSTFRTGYMYVYIWTFVLIRNIYVYLQHLKHMSISRTCSLDVIYNQAYIITPPLTQCTVETFVYIQSIHM